MKMYGQLRFRNPDHSLRFVNGRAEIKQKGWGIQTLNQVGIEMLLLGLAGDASDEGLDRAAVLFKALEFLDKHLGKNKLE